MTENLTQYNKIYNAAKCLIDLIALENEFIEKNQLEKVASISSEKNFLINIIFDQKTILSNIFDDKTTQSFDITENERATIREIFLKLMSISEENARLIAKRLCVINTIISSTQRFAKGLENKLSLYNANGKNLNFSNKVGNDAFTFNSRI